MTDTPETDTPATRSRADAARRSVESSYASAREAAGKALTRTRDSARDAAKRAGDTVSENPISVLVGGLAVGVLAGSLLPRSQREIAALKPVGRKINAAAGAAVEAAKEAGKAELVDLSLTRDAARDQTTRIIEGLVHAATKAGAAAIESGKKA